DEEQGSGSQHLQPVPLVLTPLGLYIHRIPPYSCLLLVVHVSHATAGASQERRHERLRGGRSCACPAPTPPAARHALRPSLVRDGSRLPFERRRTARGGGGHCSGLGARGVGVYAGVDRMQPCYARKYSSSA